MTNELKEKIAKIYELVKRGATEGEKQAAQVALDRLLKKYNLDGLDLDNLDKLPYKFKYATGLELMLLKRLQTFFLEGYIKSHRQTLDYATDGKSIISVKEVVMFLTYIDYVTIDSAYEYFRRHMKGQWNKLCATDIKRKRSAKTKTKRREQLQELFFTKYIIASGLYNQKELTTVDISKMSAKEHADRDRLSGVEGGKYKTQVQTGAMLNERN